jgi:hypothetical protein
MTDPTRSRLDAALATADVSVLSVGSGDGSQQAAIVQRGHRNLTATYSDSRDDVLRKYPSSATAHLATVEQLAMGRTRFGIDATRLDPDLFGGQLFDVVFFSSPHTGVSNGNIRQNVSGRCHI